MDGQAITFDFHDTLAHCPEWFDLEVRRLPSAFLGWWSAERDLPFSQETLADADARYRLLRREIIEHGNELTAEACLEAVFAGMAIEFPEPELRAGVEHLMRETLAGISPVPGSVETVLSLYEHGIPLGVVSSAVYHPFLVWTLERFGISGAMQTVITSASAGFYKSRPEIYLYAAQQLAATPKRMVHIGDSLRFDVGGAARAGMGTVWLNARGAEAAEDHLAPDLTLHTLRRSSPEILRLLASRDNGHLASRDRAEY